MPIPDEIIPKQPEVESDDQKDQRKRWELVTGVSNALSGKASACQTGAQCSDCTELCPELLAFNLLDSELKGAEKMLEITPAVLSAIKDGNTENLLAALTPGGIEAQEAAGQVALVNSAVLPKTMLNGCTREKLEAMGIRFLDDADQIFVNVQLPSGWKKQATDHSMWSDLLDDKGRKRAAIFYKAAFYDKHAHISLCSRYSVDNHGFADEHGNSVKFGQHSHLITTCKDGETVIHVGLLRAQDAYGLSENHYALAESWLNENFPEWQNPLSYWD
jgi:hypothetical protein